MYQEVYAFGYGTKRVLYRERACATSLRDLRQVARVSYRKSFVRCAVGHSGDLPQVSAEGAGSI